MSQLPDLSDLIRHVEAARPAATPLEQLTTSVATSRHLGDLADHLVGHFVDKAREGGASWAEIGDALGVSKQAAQKRFVPRGGVMGNGRGRSFLERMTQDAARVAEGAPRLCRELGHPQVGTGHILLALVDRPTGVTARVLENQGLTPDRVRDAVISAMGPGLGDLEGHIPFGPDAKKVLELSLREALRLQDDRIDTVHILLALLRDEKSLGATTLTGLGVDRAAVEAVMTD